MHKREQKGRRSALSLKDLIDELNYLGKPGLIMGLVSLLRESGIEESETVQVILESIISVAENSALEDLKIARCDMLGNQLILRQVENRISEEIDKKKKENGEFVRGKRKPLIHPYFQIGSKSHVSVQGLFDGRFPDKKRLMNLRFPKKFEQQSAFLAPQEKLGSLVECCPLGNYMQALVMTKGEITKSYLDHLRKCLDRLIEIKKTLEAKDKFALGEEFADKANGEIERLKDILDPIFGQERIKALENECFNHAEVLYLYFLSLMMWGQIVLYAGESKSRIPLFNEVFALDTKNGTIGGRIDGLRVISINGKPLTRFHIHALSYLVQSWQKQENKSAGHLVKMLKRELKGNPELVVIDYKFRVGDGGFSGEIDKDQVLFSPLSENRDQVLGYIASAAVDTGIIIYRDWERCFKEAHFRQGELVYFFDDSAPLVHKISLDEAGVRDAWFEKVVARLVSAEERAFFRKVINLTCNAVTRLVNEKDLSSFCKTPKLPKENSVQLSLFPEKRKKEKDPFKEAVEKTRKRVGKGKFIEVLDKSRSKQGLHFDRLLESMQRGWTRADNNFHLESGGYISCPNGCQGVLMYVDLGQRFYSCPCCGKKGRIFRYSIPQEYRNSGELGNNLGLPERYTEVLVLVQMVLKDSFEENNFVESFLLKRGIKNLDLVRTIVVGFVKTFKILKGKRKFFKKLLLKMDFFRRQIIERLMPAFLVVKLKIFI